MTLTTFVLVQSCMTCHTGLPYPSCVVYFLPDIENCSLTEGAKAASSTYWGPEEFYNGTGPHPYKTQKLTFRWNHSRRHCTRDEIFESAKTGPTQSAPLHRACPTVYAYVDKPFPSSACYNLPKLWPSSNRPLSFPR